MFSVPGQQGSYSVEASLPRLKRNNTVPFSSICWAWGSCALCSDVHCAVLNPIIGSHLGLETLTKLRVHESTATQVYSATCEVFCWIVSSMFHYVRTDAVSYVCSIRLCNCMNRRSLRCMHITFCGRYGLDYAMHSLEKEKEHPVYIFYIIIV